MATVGVKELTSVPRQSKLRHLSMDYQTLNYLINSAIKTD